MAVVMAADTRQAFDSVAAAYGRSNAENSILCDMRRLTLAVLTAQVPPGARMLDLGCGPGADAETLGSAGYRVTAIDSSPRMVAQARQRIAHARLEHAVDVHRLDIADLDRLPSMPYDAAYSNFGPLNCVVDLERAAAAIASRLRPGGVLVASVLGRVCPWEIALYLARGDRARASIRFARELVPVPLNGQTVWTRYYTPAEFERMFAAAGFEHVHLRALGLFVPPPYLNAFADRHPRLTAALQRLEDAAGGWPGVRSLGDHFLIVLRKNRSNLTTNREPRTQNGERGRGRRA
jgi:SAM-dependent methyltransferase